MNHELGEKYSQHMYLTNIFHSEERKIESIPKVSSIPKVERQRVPQKYLLPLLKISINPLQNSGSPGLMQCYVDSYVRNQIPHKLSDGDRGSDSAGRKGTSYREKVLIPASTDVWPFQETEAQCRMVAILEAKHWLCCWRLDS